MACQEGTTTASQSRLAVVPMLCATWPWGLELLHLRLQRGATTDARRLWAGARQLSEYHNWEQHWAGLTTLGVVVSCPEHRRSETEQAIQLLEVYGLCK